MEQLPLTFHLPNFTGCSLDGGRYQVLEYIGSGGFGKVYRVYDSHRMLKRRQALLAIKCLCKPEHGSRACVLQRREFDHHKLVSGHPNIVAFHRHFSDDRYAYVVQDFWQGEDLHSVIMEQFFSKNKHLIKPAFLQLIEAVSHCHKNGIFHRDIKPENVLCSQDGQHLCLSDFGLSTTSPFSIELRCGSCYHISPECIGEQGLRQEYATGPNDIWALGVIFTNIMTGRTPWEYATVDDRNFASYLKNNDHLKNTLPISEGINEILKEIFVLNPARRLTLPELRSRISALDTFVTPLCSSVVESEVPLADPVFNKLNTHASWSGSAPKEEEIELHSRFFSDASVPSSNFSSSSGSESKGPATPITHATVGPHIDVPDISSTVLDDDAGSSSVSCNPQHLTTSEKVKQTGDLFRAVCRRFKFFSRAGLVQ